MTLRILFRHRCLAAFATFTLSGCATLMSGPTQQISINSNPEGANVTLDSHPLGTTPLVTSIKRGESKTLVLTKEGYKPASATMESQTNGWVFWNAVFLTPGVLSTTTDSNTGAIRKYAPDRYMVTLVPGGAGPLEATTALSPHQRIVNFVVDSYRQIVRELDGAPGSHLPSLLELLQVSAEDRAEATAKIRALSRAYSDIPTFAERVSEVTIVRDRIVASPSQALQSDIDEPSYKFPERADDFALVVGIGRYKDLPEAQFAARDAATMRAHLVALGYPARHVVLLQDENATRSGLQKYLSEWLPRNVKPNSTVFFYYSGHGAPDLKTGQAYLVPWDGDPQYLESTAFSLKQVYESLERVKAKRVIVALDSCFSGAGGRSVLARGARPLVTKVETAVPASGLLVFAAASGEEITGTLEDQGHGMFTYYFLKGLAGSAKWSSGALTAGRLLEYVKLRVQDAAKLQNRDQTPLLQGGDANETIANFNPGE